MKKLLLIVLALMLACAAICEGAAADEGAEKFIGDWQDGETFILIGFDEDGIRALIIQARDDGQTEWDYVCAYDEETGALRSLPGGVRREIVFDENGEFVSSDAVYEDGAASFFVDENDRLTWTDEKDGAGSGLAFERLPGFEPLFSDMNEAMESEGYTGMEGSSDGFYVAVVELDGTVCRVVAELDETALMLEEAIFDSDDLSAATEAYEEYIKTLPVSYVEEIIQLPLTKEELEALAGRTVDELEEEGFEALSYGELDDAFVVTLSLGMYDYDFTVNGTVDIQALWDGEADYALLTVGKGEYAGLSPNVTDLNYLPDGSWFDPEFDLGEDSEGFDLMGVLFEAVQSGEIDLETLKATLTEAMPDQAEEIMGYLEMMMQLYGGSEGAVAGD